MSNKFALVGVALSCVVGCASHPQPTENLASSMASIRGAKEAGAERVPEAALHVKLAEEQVEQAKRMIADGDNERADRMTIRAYNDAELALAIARSEDAKRKLASFQGPTDVENTNAPVESTSGGARQPPTAGGSISIDKSN